jgi:hypothetical protein
MRIIGLLLVAVVGVALTAPALALTLSCHLGGENVVISFNPDDGSAFEHLRRWEGVFQASDGAYRIALSSGVVKKTAESPEGYTVVPWKKAFELGLPPPFGADLVLEIDRYSGRANSYWSRDGLKKFSGNSQNCRAVDKQLF